MDLGLNNLKWLICYKTKQDKTCFPKKKIQHTFHATFHIFCSSIFQHIYIYRERERERERERGKERENVCVFV